VTFDHRIRGWPHMPRQLMSFAVVGAGRTLFSVAVYLGLNFFLPYWASFTISFAATVALSALANSTFVFMTNVTLPRLVTYFGVYVLSYLVSLALTVFVVDGLGISPSFVPLIIGPTMFPVNFVLERWALGVSTGGSRFEQGTETSTVPRE
jgi:putative flippase GtrA